MPIKCPVCEGKAIAKNGGRRLSETITRKWFICKECNSRIPALVEIKIDIDVGGIRGR